MEFDLGALLNLALSAGAIGALAMAGMQRGIVQNLRDSRDDMLKDLDRAKSRMVDLEKRVTQAEADRDALARVVTGEAHLVAITHALEAVAELLDRHHNEAESHWQKLDKDLDQLAAVLRALDGPRGLTRWADGRGED